MGKWVVVVAVVMVACCAGRAAWGDDTKTAERPDPSGEFFGAERLHVVHLRLSAADWQLMQPTRRPRAASLSADSIPAPTVKKGAATPAPVAPAPVERERGPAVSGDKLAANNFG